jgi:hypothetical protein
VSTEWDIITGPVRPSVRASEVAHKWRCIFLNKHLWLDSENEIIFSELSTCKYVIGAILCRQSCSVCLSVCLSVRMPWCWEREREKEGKLPACLRHFRNTFMEMLSISLVHFNNMVAGWHVPLLHYSNVLFQQETQTAQIVDLQSENKINCSWCYMITELQNYRTTKLQNY